MGWNNEEVQRRDQNKGGFPKSSIYRWDFVGFSNFLNHPAMGDPPGKPQFKVIVECMRTGRMILTTKVWTFLSAIKKSSFQLDGVPPSTTIHE